MFNKHKAKHEIEINPSTGIQNKVTNEIERRFNSAKRIMGKITSSISKIASSNNNTPV